jgi:hypothetical protein
MLDKYDRAKLLDEVWTEAVTLVAPRYQLSDVGLQKLCRRLQIPTPPRGYWTRLKTGKPVAPRPKLREYIGHPMHLFRTPAPPVPPAPQPMDERLAALLVFERDPANHILVPDHIRHWHPLVVAAQQSLKKPVIDQREMPSTRRPALSISVSSAQQARALKVADVLLKAFEVRVSTHMGIRRPSKPHPPIGYSITAIAEKLTQEKFFTLARACCTYQNYK